MTNVPSSDDRAPYDISRRRFLGGTALVVLPAICGGCADNGPTIVDLPRVANNTIAVPLSGFPDLAKSGGSIIGRADGYGHPIVIARVGDTGFAALDAVCTHQACVVEYNALNLTLDCPCHGSTYEVDGRVINGPALVALKKFTATSDGTTLMITLP